MGRPTGRPTLWMTYSIYQIFSLTERVARNQKHLLGKPDLQIDRRSAAERRQIKQRVTFRLRYTDNSVFSASMMEHTLRSSLEILAAQFTAATDLSKAAIGQRSINDNTFFTRLAKGEAGFNIRTYDRVVLWLSENWPEGIDWPDGVARPERSTVAA